MEKKEKQKGELATECVCPYCPDGVLTIWLNPSVSKELFNTETWVYRCDRCGKKIMPGLYVDREANTDLVQLVLNERAIKEDLSEVLFVNADPDSFEQYHSLNCEGEDVRYR
jgi:hypothetical protein